MHLLRMQDVRVGFSGLELFTVDQLNIYSGERIGLIGANGSGKSTLLRLFMGELDALSGSIQRWGDWQIFRQFDDACPAENLSVSDPGIWGMSGFWNPDPATMSGGEKTRSRLVRAFSAPGDIILLDEPTANLDMDGILQLSDELRRLDSFILISHDRTLLNEHCTRILDIRECRLFDYPGNYDDYLQWREADIKRRRQEYELYREEQDRLTGLAADLRKRAHKNSKKPKGIYSSEAKQRDFTASRRSQEGKAKSLESQARHTEKRLEQLEIKDKPTQAYVIRPDFRLTDPPQNKAVAEAVSLSFGFEHAEPLFTEAAFQLKRNKRTALIGPNGSGKSVLCRLLTEGHEAIRSVPKAKYGFYRQEMELVDLSLSVLQNMRAVSCQREQVDRSVLARMGFFRDRVHQPASELSGGERVKLSFAMLFVSDANVLVLDEPTNYLDIPSLEAIQSLLADFEGTILFVSHDRTFVQALADEIWEIQDGKIKVTAGAN